jgi:hypothetical protein
MFGYSAVLSSTLSCARTKIAPEASIGALLDFSEAGEIERHLTKSRGDSCGCALSAKFMVVALAISGIYYGWRFATGDLSSPRLVSRVFLVTFVAAGIGKVIGILRHRRRRKAVFRVAR